jgi:hypothetical protein
MFIKEPHFLSRPPLPATTPRQGAFRHAALGGTRRRAKRFYKERVRGGKKCYVCKRCDEVVTASLRTLERSVHRTRTCVEGQYFHNNQGQGGSNSNGPGKAGDAYKRQEGDSGTVGNGSTTVNMGPSAMRDDGYEASRGS